MLNYRKKIFAQEYLKDHNATQAAIRAGYSKNCANITGGRLLKDLGVLKIINKEQVKVEKECHLTREYVISTIMFVIEKCMGKREGEKFDATNVLKGTEQLAKILDMYSTEKSDNQVTVVINK